MTFDSLLQAILTDDLQSTKRLLAKSPELAVEQVSEATLYQTGIFHWIYEGDTALHLAAAGYRVELARLLIKAGADVNAAHNHRLGAPLHYAADGYINHPAWNPKRQAAMIRCLVEAGADVDARDKNGATPLHRAVRTRCAAAVKCLFDAGCDATIRNNSGSTPFHLAVQSTGRGGSGADIAKAAQQTIIAEFVAHGQNPNVKDGKGKTVMDLAGSWSNLLISHNGAGVP